MQEAERAAERARYDEEIAERDTRLAASPEFQASVADWKREAETNHSRKVKEIKAMAKLT